MSSGRWSDLIPRIGSALVMVAAGLGAVWAGGHVFHLFIALLCGAMGWELARMVAPATPTVATQLGLLVGGAVLLSIYVPVPFVLPILLAPALVGYGQVTAHRVFCGLFLVAIAMTGYQMMHLLDDLGVVWLLWLLLIVIASDVAGYFAGKSIGGAKFWPRISPNKTWSGTIAGWVGAAIVGTIFAFLQSGGGALVLYSVFVAFAAQMGDIAESALKRRVGVKDSSALIPGHGGLMDRFDGMMGASVFLLLTSPLIGLPAGGN